MIFFDGFIDAYYASDPNQARVREFTTQAPRTDGPSLNLIHGGIGLKEKNFRGRLALQGGNSVTANTLLEPDRALGHIQESYLGMKLGEKTWIDAGVYLGHIGMESWISKNNITYTRSLNLDYVPYYQTGVRLSHEMDEKTHLELHLMQGWQNISETNAAKSFGIQAKRAFERWTFTYNNYFGDDQVVSKRNRFRTYHNFIAEVPLSESMKFVGSIDLGTQAQQRNGGTDAWTATALVLQKKLSEKNYLGLRLEYYADPHQANVATRTPNGFVVTSGSVNVDHHFTDRLLWRTELRNYRSRDKIYPTDHAERKRTDLLAVTALSWDL